MFLLLIIPHSLLFHLFQPEQLILVMLDKHLDQQLNQHDDFQSSLNIIAGLPTVLSAWLMYIFQSIFNFFVVSGSGQAALTMPLMAPLADIAGVSRQVSVLAFQLGDSFTNLIVPTSAVMMASIGAARIDWGTWVKWQIKFQAILFAFGSLFIVGAVLMGLK